MLRAHFPVKLVAYRRRLQLSWQVATLRAPKIVDKGIDACAPGLLL
jgi:hypothetical protein